MSTGTLGNAAAALARRGLPVFPLLPRAKLPPMGSHGHLDATTTAATIAQWWQACPAANIGVRVPLGMAVVDIDPRHGGDVEMRKLAVEHGRLPHTWTAVTQSGGWHYWFVVGEMALRSTLAPGIDIKTHTGYVLAPPSFVVGRYRWLKGRSPFDISRPAAAPQWLRDSLTPPPYVLPAVSPIPGTGALSQACLVGRLNAVAEGRRNATLFGACRDAAKQGDLDAFEPALVAAALALGLSSSEIARTVQSARAAG